MAANMVTAANGHSKRMRWVNRSTWQVHNDAKMQSLGSNNSADSAAVLAC